MKHERVCVIGGGGFVGHHLVSRLVAEGRRVRVPTRRRQRILDLTVLPTVEVVEADVHDPTALRALLDGMDAAVNLVGILHGTPAEFTRAHVELPQKLVAACAQAGVGRLLHMSALGAEAGSRSVYQRTKAQGEAAVLQEGARAGLAVTAFRPSVIFGPGDSFLRLFAGLMRLAPVLPLAGAWARFQPVYVRDVARAFALALDDADTHGEVYALCGPRVYTLQELVQLTARTLGLKRWVIPLGRNASYAFARLMELKPGRKLMTRDNYYAMLTDNVCPQGFPARFGAPTALEAVIDYLRCTGPHCGYELYRAQARR
ncbi:MAG: complex I NDUFA9 subunit family protein [Thiobacillaceae bacterium]|nr:complex I NDUFA9 subunit family protein [Thiobacillaceae bacterium]MDW8324568.1 complex I NDUFA9 subunit family protein [Burkholderiales bacterium]